MYCKFCDKLTNELSPRGPTERSHESDASKLTLSYCPKCHLVYAE